MTKLQPSSLLTAVVLGLVLFTPVQALAIAAIRPNELTHPASTPSFMAQATAQYLEQGIQLGQAGDVRGAEAAFRKVIQLDPTSFAAHYYLGVMLYKQGGSKVEEAIEAYRDSIKINPNLFIARVNIGIAQYQMGQTKAAQISLGEAKGFLPRKIESLENLENYIALSAGLRQISQFHESIQIIRQAIGLNPYISNAAVCQLTFETLEPLRIPLELTLRAYRSARCELRTSLPVDQNLQKKQEEIHQTIRSAVSQKSIYAEAYKKVGLEEIVLIEPHTLFEPNYPNDRLNKAYSIAHLNLGIDLLNRAMLAGDSASMEEAITSFQKSLQYDSNYPWTDLYLSIALIAQGQLENAISTVQKVLKLSNVTAIYTRPTNTHVWAYTILGYALQLQGNFRAAATEYQHALQLDKAFTPARSNLAEMRSK